MRAWQLTVAPDPESELPLFLRIAEIGTGGGRGRGGVRRFGGDAGENGGDAECGDVAHEISG
jgi:hypothetical protein